MTILRLEKRADTHKHSTEYAKELRRTQAIIVKQMGE